MKKISKTEAEKEIGEFFKNIEDKSSGEIKKIKKLAMGYNIQLKDLRKKFCRKCYSPLKGKTRIKNGKKVIICERCGKRSRWKNN
jgi:RNase P subunit RPR2